MPVSARSDASVISRVSTPSSRMRPLGRLVEARNEIDERALPRAARADERDDRPLAAPSKLTSLQHRLRLVREARRARTRSSARARSRRAFRDRVCCSVGSSSTSNKRSAAASDCCAVVGACESCLSGGSSRITIVMKTISDARVHAALPLSTSLRADPEDEHRDRHADHLGQRLRERRRRD